MDDHSYAQLANLVQRQQQYEEQQQQEQQNYANGKRKADDGQSPPPGQRAKRNRYISIACNGETTRKSREVNVTDGACRVQAAQDQVQRRDTLHALRQPES